MNMRQHKRSILARIQFNNAMAAWYADGYFAGPDESLVELMAKHDEMQKNIETKAEVIEQVWKVARVKDNVVVLEAKSAEEAKEAIDKAARQKRAKLFLLDGEPFLYTA